MADDRERVETERAFAEQAIDEAKKSLSGTRVGVVVVVDDQAVATGHTGEVEGQHAEQVALQKAQDAGTNPHGAHVYCTLEPCANSRTSRIPCAELLVAAGVTVVHIGEYDPNPQVYRLGWKYLRDHGVQLRDFPADLRQQAHKANVTFTQLFSEGVGLTGGGKFDLDAQGGTFTIRAASAPDSPSWQTTWSRYGLDGIYLYGGVPGVVAYARYVEKFDEIDDPDALNYENHSPMIPLGGIGVVRNRHGHALCQVTKIELIARTSQLAVTLKWQLRLAAEHRHDEP